MRIALFYAMACLAAALSARAGAGLEPFIGYGYGSTLYRLEMTFPIVGDSVPNDVKGLGQSELEYPLDALLVGARYRYEAPGAAWGLHAGAWANASDAGGTMKDTDWSGARGTSGSTTSSVLFKFSFTESRPEMVWFGGEAGFDVGGSELMGKPVCYGLSVRADRLDVELFGAKGWQKPFDGPRQNVDFAPDSLVLTYGLTRIVPRLTSEILWRASDGVRFATALTAGPAFAWDHDDHVLRGKYSDTFAWGYELGGNASLESRLTRALSILFRGEFAYSRAKGEMDQRFYADDPGTPDDETGLEFNNVVTRIIGLGGSVSAGLRYLF